MSKKQKQNPAADAVAIVEQRIAELQEQREQVQARLQQLAQAQQEAAALDFGLQGAIQTHQETLALLRQAEAVDEEE